MTEEELFQWAVSQMKWERMVAKEHGTRIKPIKGGGVKALNEMVQTILRKKSPNRARVAAKAIEEVIRESYGLLVEP